MTIKHFRFQLLSLLFCALLPLAANAAQSDTLQPQDIKPRFIEVQELDADYHTESKTITISGKIKNVSRSRISGYATIYLLSAEGQELYSYQEEINGGEGFAHGTTVDFSATSLVGDISKVSSISIDFTQK